MSVVTKSSDQVVCRGFLFRIFLCVLLLLVADVSCRLQKTSMPLSGSVETTTVGNGLVLFQIGGNVNGRVRSRLNKYMELLGQSTNNKPSTKSSNAVGKLCISFGDAPWSRMFINRTIDLDGLGPDAFIVKTIMGNRRDKQASPAAIPEGCQCLVVCDGNRGALNTSFYPIHADINNGVSYAAYSVLAELFSFGFNHPLKPTISPIVNAKKDSLDLVQLLIKNNRLPLNLIEKPHVLPRRGVHIHTEHPLELTHFLNGFSNEMSEMYHHWKEGMDDWEKVCEWLVANRQNSVQFVLLYGSSWSSFADSVDRQKRLSEIVQMAHEWGIDIGLDVPIVMEQQHAWRLIRKLGNYEDEIRQLYQHIDYVCEANFDFMASEVGFSEFTHGSAERMLSYLNASAIYLDEKWGKKFYVKIHISQGQTIPEFIDPLTGKPGLNFNFLPYYADARVSIMPHTVQMFSLTDPAYTYGNKNFTQLRDFMFLELGNREVVWHPETAYWVTFDSNVPLILPTYIDRRLYDLRYITNHCMKVGKKIDGQIIFSSGWEYGYWLNDIAVMRIAWNPHMEEENHSKALLKVMDDVTKSFVFDEKIRNDFNLVIHQLAESQTKYLIKGEVGGVEPADMYRKSGISLLEGWDTWSDLNYYLSKTIGTNMATQPDKLQYFDVRIGFDQGIYQGQVRPLLLEMIDSFNKTTNRLGGISTDSNWFDLYSDIFDSTNLLLLRAQCVYELFEFAHSKYVKDDKAQLVHASNARSVIDRAQTIVNHRISNFRVKDLSTIVGWNYNPTSYPFGYLWTTKNLYFWWRDYAKIVLGKPNPCFMNIQNPLDVAIGEGAMQVLAELVRELLEKFKYWDLFADCLAAPLTEPPVPPFQP